MGYTGVNVEGNGQIAKLEPELMHRVQISITFSMTPNCIRKQINLKENIGRGNDLAYIERN